MIKKLILTTAISVLLSITLQAEEKAAVSMSTASYQLVVAKDKNGKEVKKWLKTSKVVPGDTVKYIDTITNDSDEALKDAKISNPINENLVFVEGSAKSKVKFSTKYSVDGGKSYDEPNKLFVIGRDKKKRQATAKDYSAIQFRIHEVPPKSKVNVEFKVKIK